VAAGAGVFAVRLDATGANQPTFQRTVSPGEDVLQAFRADEQHFDVAYYTPGGCSSNPCLVPQHTVCRVPYAGIEPSCLGGADTPGPLDFDDLALLPSFESDTNCLLAARSAKTLEVQLLFGCASKDAANYPPFVLPPMALGAADLAPSVRPVVAPVGVSRGIFFALTAPGQGSVGVLRLNEQGPSVALDTDFGSIESPGYVLRAVGVGLSPTFERKVEALALDFNNNVFAAGETLTNGLRAPFIAKFAYDGGGLDPGFGQGGVVEASLGDDGAWSCLLIDDQRRLIAIGEAKGVPIARRLTPEGALDPSFAGTGEVELPFAAQSCAFDTTGRLVLAGGAVDGGGQGVARATRLRNE
jgi:hypothetical protein